MAFKSEIRKWGGLGYFRSDFEFRSSFDFRNSDFA